MTVRIVRDSFRAGMMIDTIGPELRGASLRLGVRRASRGRVKKGSNQGAAGSSSERFDSGTGKVPLFDRRGDGLELLLQEIELALHLGHVLLGTAQRHAVLGE